MSMSCEQTRMLLSAFAEGTLSAADHGSVAEHLVLCSQCRDLADALSAGLSALQAPPANSLSADLTGAVLAATSGASCGRCEDQLVAHRDGELDADSFELMNQHFEHCGDCRALAQVLGWLTETLPAMREVELDHQFTAEVLARTSARPPRPWEAMAARLRQWAQRPLFPVEAAYVATLLLVLLFGTSFSPFQDLPQSTLAWLRGENGGTQTAGAPRLTGIRAEAEEGVKRLVGPAEDRVTSTRVKVFNNLEVRARASWTGLVEVGGGMGDLAQAMFGKEGYGVAPSLQHIGDGFRQTWRGLRQPQEEAKVPQGP